MSRHTRLVRLVMAALVVGAAACTEAPPTFTADIGPLVFENCSKCHRPGQNAPFDLLTYDDVRRHARQIAEVTASGYMPPWLPDDVADPFVGSPRLTRAQIARIGRWVDEGAVEGDPSALPPAPAFPEGWLLGPPDLIVEMPEPYTLPASGPDVYRNFVIRAPVEATRHVRTFEFKPDNEPIVHHAFVLTDPTSGSRRQDARDPAPGFDGIHPPESATAPSSAFLTWTPGRQPWPGDPGFSWPLERNTDLVLQLHLQPTGKPETIQARIGLYFDDRPATRAAYKIGLFSKDLEIPAGDPAWTVEQSYTLPVDVDLLAVLPHAHFLGKSMEVWADLPSGRRRPLLHIPRWDFNWQDSYRWAEPVALPKGTTVSMLFTYDNSADNPFNPHSPPQRITYGLQSVDEMCELWLLASPATEQDLATLREDYDPILMRQVLRDADLALQSDPDDAQAHLRRGQALAALGRLFDATVALQRALELEPRSIQALQMIAVVYESTSRHDDAQKALERAVELDPADPALHFELGSFFFRREQLDQAGMAYQEAYYLDPADFRTNLQLGVVLARIGRPDLAIKHFEDALRVRPGDSDATRNLDRARALVNQARRR